jgi:hypothetical protein
MKSDQPLSGQSASATRARRASARLREGPRGYRVESAKPRYRSGVSRDWIKMKNSDSPFIIRAREAEW